MEKTSCRLCNQQTNFFKRSRGRDYYRCTHCDAIQMDEKNLLSLDQEKNRYQLHNNDVHDVNYQKFVSPITSYVLDNFNKNNIGLDFGAGPGPVISKVLTDHKYNIKQYDPYFHPHEHLLNEKYDYVIACEVIEHFNKPKSAFSLLNQVLKNEGSWIFMTELYHDDIDFSQWYYKNDETHVFFYTKKTLQYIKGLYHFKDLSIENRLIVFKR